MGRDFKNYLIFIFVPHSDIKCGLAVVYIIWINADMVYIQISRCFNVWLWNVDEEEDILLACLVAKMK